MKDITVIIPLHEFTEESAKLTANAVSTVPSDYEIILSVKKETPSKDLKIVSDALNGRDLTIVATSDGNSFTELVNAATEVVKSKYFSILEYDDEYTVIWFDEAERQIEFMPNVSVFMPLEDIMDFNDKKYIGFGNEAAWASAFSNEIGFIDLDCLQNYFDFYLTGSIFNLEDWQEVGGLKPSIKITFWYEWLLRATNKGKKVYVIPKVGYKHFLARENSLTEIYKKEIDNDEVQWWFDLAKREYFYKNDRKKTYSKLEEEETEG